MLPENFQFSQSNLQDYVECPRRFQLRYLTRLTWPAVEVEPILVKEAHMQRGTAFHQMVQQHLLGLNLAPKAARDDVLGVWWANFLNYGLNDLPIQRHAEKTLSIKLAGYPLIAKYDLIALDAERAVIVDWKTTHKRPTQAWLAARLQTRIYRYVLARAGAELNGGQMIAPSQITMRYWFANFPDEPLNLSYSTQQYQKEEADLSALIKQIEVEAERGGDFPLVADTRPCRFCQYRSLCGRGEYAGEFIEAEAAYDAEVGAIFSLEDDLEVDF